MSNTNVLKFITPAFSSIFPKLNKPDTKWKASGDFKVGLDATAGLPEAVVEKLEAMRDALVEETKAALTAAKKGAKVKSLVVKDILITETDKESGEPTGRLLLKAKTAATYMKNGVEVKKTITMFDAKGTKLTVNPDVWGGSVLKVSLQAQPYYTAKDNEVGIAFYINAVQIIKLVTGGGGSAESYGFGQEEGYTAEDAPASSDSDDGDDAGATDGAEF